LLVTAVDITALMRLIVGHN